MSTNWPEKVIHNLSAISMKGQLFMNGYHFDDQFLSKSDTYFKCHFNEGSIICELLFLVGSEILVVL